MSQESEFLKSFYLSQSIKQEILWYIQKTESSTWLVAIVFSEEMYEIHPEEMETTLRFPSCGKLQCQVTQSSVCRDGPYHFGHTLQFVGRRAGL
jgi:hypothetical protein